MHSNIYFFQSFVFFLTGVVLKPSKSSNTAQKFWYILLDLCEFFQILEGGDFFLKKNISLKRKVQKIFKKLGMFFGRYVYTKNYEEYWRHHNQILIELSRNAPYVSYP